MLKLVTITPHRNRLPQLRHHLRSIAEQTRPPDQVVVSCQGDTIETRREIVELLEATGVPKQMWAVGASDDPWCKPLAINWAIRRTEEDVDVVATLDVDCILHPEMIAQLEIALEQDSDRYVMCQNLSLPKHFGIPYHWTYEGLREHARFLEWKGARERCGPMSMSWGCLQAARRDWWFEVRGADEEMKWWGPEDHDLAKRAHAAGLKWHWLPKRYALIHQWHKVGQWDPGMRKRILANNQIMRQKLRRGEIARNPDGWGGME